MTDADDQTADEIKRLAHDLLDAGRRRDRATLERLLADDFLIAGWQPGGGLADKQVYLDDMLRPIEIQEGSFKFDRWRVRIHGDDIALVNCILDIRAVVEGHPWGAEVLVSDVWVKEPIGWRVLARHTSPVNRAGA